MTDRIHHCKAMPEHGVRIFKREADSPTGPWVLTITREATEEHLEENCYFELIGDTVWETTVTILCCPYCGTRLTASDKADFTDGQWYQHRDCSGWYSKIV